MMRAACLGIVLLAQAASAQSLPDAKGLLEREASALDSYASYRYDEATTLSLTVPGAPQRMEMTVAVTGAAGGRRRMETRMSALGGGTQVMVADGKQTWLYMPEAKVYGRLPNDGAVPSPLQALVPTLNAARPRRRSLAPTRW